MYNVIISAVVGLVVAGVCRLFNLPWYACIVPAFLAFVGAFVLLARRTAKQVNAIMTLAQRELSVQATNPKQQRQMVEKAIAILKQALAFDKWQFLIASEVHAQVGMLRYMIKDFDEAQTHLTQANPRNPMAMAIQGALYYQRKDYSKMESSFEAAVKAGKKESLVWAAYAWCLLQLKEKEKALQVMSRAVETNPSDEKLKNGLIALQNDKKLKMKPYEPAWWQFGLETPPMQVMGGRRVQFDRR